jgi:hypothetical protein
MRKITVLLIIGCLLVVMPGYNYNSRSSTPAPAVSQTAMAPTTENLPPVTSIQPSSNPTTANTNNIFYSYILSRAQLPYPASWYLAGKVLCQGDQGCGHFLLL